jgi:hypothetical protein
MIADASPQIADESAASLHMQASQQSSLPDGVEYLDEDPNMYNYNDSFDNGRATAAAPSSSSSQTEEDLIADLNLNDGADLNLGSLGAT